MNNKTKPALTTVWQNIKKRCLNKADTAFKNYGARGITLCKRWHDFDNFLKDMGPSYGSGLQIERRNNNAGYSPENCKWATPVEQANNKRNNRVIEFHGETKTLAEWARHLGIPYSTLISRINKHKWPIARALSTPKLRNPKTTIIEYRGSRKTAKQWSIELRIPLTTILYRASNNNAPESILRKTTRRRRSPLYGKKFLHDGEMLSIPQLAEKHGIKYCTLVKRLNKGWKLEKCLSR